MNFIEWKISEKEKIKWFLFQLETILNTIVFHFETAYEFHCNGFLL